MPRLAFIYMSLSALILSACGPTAAAPTLTVAPPTSTATDIPTVAPTNARQPTATLEPTPTVPDISACRIPAQAFTNVGFGVPNPSYKLPSIGTVKTEILFADFSDVPATQRPEQIFALISPNAEKFFNDVSYGKMTWQLEPHFVWMRLSQPSAHYGEAIRTYAGHLEFIQEAVTLADAEVDFSNVDSVVVMVPPEATAVGYGPAFGANADQGYQADGKRFSNGVTSGADLTSWGYLWLNHESGHTMGLPDLYAYQYDPSNYDDLHRFAGGFGLMGFISGGAPEYFAFERWQLGWLDDDQIVCQQDNDQTTTLTPIETADGLKAVMVPVSDSKVVVIESRRALGYDRALPKSGALVYTVDTSIASGKGPLSVFPVLDNDPYRYESPLAAGEWVTVAGVTITVLEASDRGDRIQVTVLK